MIWSWKVVQAGQAALAIDALGKMSKGVVEKDRSGAQPDTQIEAAVTLD